MIANETSWNVIDRLILTRHGSDKVILIFFSVLCQAADKGNGICLDSRGPLSHFFGHLVKRFMYPVKHGFLIEKTNLLKWPAHDGRRLKPLSQFQDNQSAVQSPCLPFLVCLPPGQVTFLYISLCINRIACQGSLAVRADIIRHLPLFPYILGTGLGTLPQ